MHKQKVGYDVIDFLSKSLALRFRLNGRYFTHVIGISRGGLLPAKIISYALEIEMLTYGISNYSGTTQNKETKVTQSLDFNTLDDSSRLLIIDDKADTGKTIDYIREEIGTKFDFVRYATLFAEKRAKEKVDHYGVLVPDNTWIDFPWE